MNNKSWLISLLIPIVLFTCAAPRSSTTQNKPSENNDPVKKSAGLSCKILAPCNSKATNGYVDAVLILENTGEHPVRVCTLYAERQHTSFGRGWAEVEINPGWWKSDSPSPDEFAKHTVTINPGFSLGLPFKVTYANGNPLKFSAAYEIDERFAKQYNTWSGRVEAEPITVNVVP